MPILENKAVQISIKNLKDKLRHWQYVFFSLLLPIMFTIMFYFMLGTEKDPTGRSNFDYGFPGMIIYAIGIGTMNAAIMFAQDKKSGMLTRLDTMPTGRKNIFLGALISESLFLMLQIAIMFVFGMFLGGPLMYITVPMFAPVIEAMGYSLIWFGIVIIKMTETGAITPPVCIVLFIAQGIIKEVPIERAYRSIWWFVLCDVLTIGLFVGVPQLVTFLPDIARG